MSKKRKVNPLRVLILILPFVLILGLIVGFVKTKVANKVEPEEPEPEIITEIINNTNKDIIYLAVGDNYQLNYSFTTNEKDTTSSLNYSSSNPSAVYVNNDGLIKAVGGGEATITISINDIQETIKVISTSLIYPINNNYESKSSLPCGIYSKEDNDLLDEILKDRINDGGYKTRAGVVAAARFLTLEFPYRINYFYENGRITSKADGEGRYYHEGLYLNESRYESIVVSSSGPKCWGCSLYSEPIETNMPNGLDCSGFVTWALVNGGFDPGDVGAGGEDYSNKTLFFFGERENIVVDSINKIKAGDLVHNEKASGHIGIIIGIDDEHVYVAQATWQDSYLFDPPYGVVVTKYTYEEFADDWNEVMLMDSYYNENGNYSNMW